MFWSSAFTAAALLVGGNAVRAADENWGSSAKTPAITLPGGAKITSFDISFVDPVIGVYLLADRTNKAVQAVDTYTNTLFTPYTATPPFAGVAHNANGTVNNDKSGPDGVLTVNHREIWAGDGNSTIKVIDLFTGKTTHVINTGGVNRADELCFDPRDQLVMMANDAESPFPFVTLISTRTYAVLKKIVMNGTNGTPKATNGIEQCQWDMRTGSFYVNIPENNGKGDDKTNGAVVEIAPSGQILHNWVVPVATCAGPQGMAVGPFNKLLLGCNNPNKTSNSTIFINNSKGSGPIIVIPGEDGADEVWYNEGNGQLVPRPVRGLQPAKAWDHRRPARPRGNRHFRQDRPPEHCGNPAWNQPLGSCRPNLQPSLRTDCQHLGQHDLRHLRRARQPGLHRRVCGAGDRRPSRPSGTLEATGKI